MRNLNLKTVLLVGIFLLVLLLALPVKAANENIVIVKQEDNSYIIYVKDYLDKEFQFAFSNDKDVEPANTLFVNSAKDTVDGENNIAYSINKITDKYMFIKANESTEVFEIDFEDNIEKLDLESINLVSKKITIKLEQEEVVNEVNENGTKITETVGVAKLEENLENVKYQLVPRKSTTENNTLFALAELLEKNEFTDKYTEIRASKEFFELKTKLENELKEEDWETVENNSVKQPKEAQTGDQYILWLDSKEESDVHFLTSYRKYDEDVIEKEVKTILPYTYDNNTILVALVIVVCAIVIVSIRIAVLKKKEMSK